VFECECADYCAKSRVHVASNVPQPPALRLRSLVLEREAALSPPLLQQPLHPQHVSHHHDQHFSLSCSFARFPRTPWHPVTRPLLSPSDPPLGWARSSRAYEPAATQTADALCHPPTAYRVTGYGMGNLAQEGAEEQRPPH
jgi:hypothetical protein